MVKKKVCPRGGKRTPVVASVRRPKRGRTSRHIIIDTRERTPFGFKAYKVRHAALKTGDYSVSGFEDVVAVERKTGADLINTIMTNKARFERELTRGLEMERFVVVVEESMAGTVLSGNGRSSAGLRPFISRIAELAAKFKVPILFCDNRAMAEVATLEILRPFLQM